MGRRKKGETPETAKAKLISRLAIQYFSSGMNFETIDDVAASIRASKKTLYSFFESKEDIILAVYDVPRQIITSYVSGQLKVMKDGDAEDFKTAYLSIFSLLLGFLSRLNMSKIDELKSTCPPVFNQLDTWREHWIQTIFIHIIENGIRLKFFRSDIEPVIAGKVYYGMINSILTSQKDQKSAVETLKAVVKIFFRGMSQDKEWVPDLDKIVPLNITKIVLENLLNGPDALII